MTASYMPSAGVELLIWNRAEDPWLNATTLCQEPHPSKGSILALSLGNKFQKVKYYLGLFATKEKSFVHEETGRGFRDEAASLVLGPQRTPSDMGS